LPRTRKKRGYTRTSTPIIDAPTKSRQMPSRYAAHPLAERAAYVDRSLRERIRRSYSDRHFPAIPLAFFTSSMNSAR
jgi:hypothetical protein